MESGAVEVDGISVSYYLYGARGPQIVLLHGYGPFLHSMNFRRFLEDMTDSYQLLAFDLLGHGRSGDPVSPIGFERHAEILHEAAVRLGFTTYNLIGYSWGGRVSLRIASKYTDSVERLVLVDIPPMTQESPRHVSVESGIPFKFKDSEAAVDWLSARMSGTPRGFLHGFLDFLFFSEDDGSWTMSSHPSRKRQLVMDGDGWMYLQDVKAPVLLVKGSESNSVSSGAVQRMREITGNLVVETVKGADHNLTFTHLTQFEGAVRTFIPR